MPRISHRGVAAVVVLGLALAACDSFTHRGEISIESVAILFGEGPDDDASTLWVPSPSCGGDPEVGVEEGAVTVTLTLVATIGSQASCAEYVEVELDAPLAERTVIDGFTGRELEVEGRHS